MSANPYFKVRATNTLPDGTRHSGRFRSIGSKGAVAAVDLFHVFVNLRIWNARLQRFSMPVETLWDTGADVTIVGQRQAIEAGIVLGGSPSPLQGIGGGARAWSVRHPVRLPYPGFEQFWFPFCFYVVEGEGPEYPLLGFRDIRANFNIASRGDDYHFFLRIPGHEGQPVVDGQPDTRAIR